MTDSAAATSRFTPAARLAIEDGAGDFVRPTGDPGFRMNKRTIALLIVAILAGVAAAVATYGLVGQHPAAHRAAASDDSDPGLIP